MLGTTPAGLGALLTRGSDISQAAATALAGLPPSTRLVLHLCLLAWATAASLRLVTWASEHNTTLGKAEKVLAAELEQEVDTVTADIEYTLNLPLGSARLLHSHLAHPLRFLVFATSAAAAALLVCSAARLPPGVGAAVLTTWQVALCAWATWTAVFAQQLAFMAWQKTHDAAGMAAAMQPLRRLSEVATLGVGCLLCLRVAGVPLAPLLAVGSVGGLSLGLATQTVAANIVAGASLVVARPFSVGDKIDLPGRGLLGVVRRFGIDSTTITLDDSTPVHIPNSELAKSTIRNTSRRTLWPVTASFRLPHATLGSGLAGEVARRLEAEARSRPDFAELAPQFVCRAVVADVSPDAVVVSITTYIASHGVDLATSERRRSEILLRLSSIITNELGIQLALPSTAVQYLANPGAAATSGGAAVSR